MDTCDRLMMQKKKRLRENTMLNKCEKIKDI